MCVFENPKTHICIRGHRQNKLNPLRCKGFRPCAECAFFNGQKRTNAKIFPPAGNFGEKPCGKFCGKLIDHVENFVDCGKPCGKSTNEAKPEKPSFCNFFGYFSTLYPLPVPIRKPIGFA